MTIIMWHKPNNQQKQTHNHMGNAIVVVGTPVVVAATEQGQEDPKKKT